MIRREEWSGGTVELTEEHIGLQGMRDRVSLLGGLFSLASSPGEGTRVIVKLPANV